MPSSQPPVDQRWPPRTSRTIARTVPATSARYPSAAAQRKATLDLRRSDLVGQDVGIGRKLRHRRPDAADDERRGRERALEQWLLLDRGRHAVDEHRREADGADREHPRGEGQRPPAIDELTESDDGHEHEQRRERDRGALLGDQQQ